MIAPTTISIIRKTAGIPFLKSPPVNAVLIIYAIPTTTVNNTNLCLVVNTGASTSAS